jgi:hypothetical protein
MSGLRCPYEIVNGKYTEVNFYFLIVAWRKIMQSVAPLADKAQRKKWAGNLKVCSFSHSLKMGHISAVKKVNHRRHSATWQQQLLPPDILKNNSVAQIFRLLNFVLS